MPRWGERSLQRSIWKERFPEEDHSPVVQAGKGASPAEETLWQPVGEGVGVVAVVTHFPGGTEILPQRGARTWERSFQPPRLRRLVSRAIPEFLTTARATWSRQRAITAGRQG